MTWYFDPAGDTVDVYAPDGTQVAAGVSVSGSWSDSPDAIEPEIRQAILGVDLSLDLQKALRWTLEWVEGDIQKGTPP
jgi:hypothetical protein